MKDPTPAVYNRYGAPTGRHTGPISEGLGDMWTLRRIKLDRGGYDPGGAYWGCGQPLYWAFNEATTEETFFRARNRLAAKNHVREHYDLRAKFHS